MVEFDKSFQGFARRDRPRDSFEKGRHESEEGKSFGSAKSEEFQTVKVNKKTKLSNMEILLRSLP
jgi:hypothetical protein